MTRNSAMSRLQVRHLNTMSLSCNVNTRALRTRVDIRLRDIVSERRTNYHDSSVLSYDQLLEFEFFIIENEIKIFNLKFHFKL